MSWLDGTEETKSNTTEANNTGIKLEEASTHKSAVTHAGTVFVTSDLDLLTPK